MKTLLESALLEAFKEVELPHTWFLDEHPSYSADFCSIRIEFYSYNYMRHLHPDSTIASYIICQLREIDGKHMLSMTEEVYIKFNGVLSKSLESRTQSTQLYFDTMIDSAREYLIYRVNSSIASNYLATSLAMGRVVYVNLSRDYTSPK